MGTKKDLQKQLKHMYQPYITTIGICNIKGYKKYGDGNENKLTRQNATNSYTSRFIT